QMRRWLAERAAAAPAPAAVTGLTRRLGTAPIPIRLPDIMRPGQREPESCPVDAPHPRAAEGIVGEPAPAAPDETVDQSPLRRPS
ncbi:MAG: YihY/virulence factor BrkB family protein, partial [Rhodococcus ruber]|nr:YihY/virulence factor BrkB family protein [Rhodococcus ruber]